MTPRNIASALLMGVGIALLADAACAPSAQSPQIDPRALARATVETAESAWLATAKACVADAAATESQATLQKCEEMLDPARETLVAAAYSVDTWTAADQKNFPCMIGSAMKAIQAGVTFLQSEQVAVPPLVSDFFNLAGYYAPQCVSASDAGAE